MTRQTEKANSFKLLGTITRVNGKKTKLTGMVLSTYRRQGQPTSVFGKMTYSMDSVKNIGRTRLGTKGLTSRAKSMERDITSSPTGHTIMVIFKIINFTATAYSSASR